MKDMVNHPKHYNSEGRKECIVEMEEKYGKEIVCTFCLTNAYKYLYRAGEKNDNPKEQDIEKAKWYYNYALRFKPTLEGRNNRRNKTDLIMYKHIEKELKKYEKHYSR